MRILLLLAWGSLLMLLVIGCGSSGGSLPYDPNDPPADPNLFKLPAQFDKTQGKLSWFYYRTASGSQDYQQLQWGAAPSGSPSTITECWKSDTQPYVVVGKGVLCPGDKQDAVIGWRVPRAGQVQITVLPRARINASTDGVAVSIWQNGTRIAEPWYLANQTSQTPTLSSSRIMASGDMVYLRFDPLETPENDWFNYQVEIAIH